MHTKNNKSFLILVVVLVVVILNSIQWVWADVDHKVDKLDGDVPKVSKPQVNKMLDEVMVTADRREERAFDVPTSIEVFDAYTIQERSYENSSELIRAVPNANFTEQRAGTGETNFSIRGVGTTTINVDQTIGVYIDDIPVSSVSEFGLEYFDVERVEVLRGPQGTLYGRNALGGVLHIKTVKPKPEREIKATASYGSFNDKRFFGVVNVPISDKLFGRFNLTHASRNARINNVAAGAADVDDLNLNAARGKLLFLPTDRLKLQLGGDVSSSDQTTGTGAFDTASSLGVNSLRPSLLVKKSSGVNLEGEYLFDWMRLVSFTSVRHQNQSGNGSRPEAGNFNPLVRETVFFNNDFLADLNQTTFTQELRLESTDTGPLKWIVGSFFQYNDADRIGDVENVSVGIFECSFSTIKSRSFAFFTDATYDLTKRFSVTAGVRASWDKKDFRYRHVGSFAPLFGFNFAPNQTLNQNKSFNDLSPRFVLEYKLTPDINLYAKASRGYKAGGFNTEFLALGVTPYGKESIWSYEGGIKSRFFNNRLQLDANIFYMDWSNQQVLVFANGIANVSNARKSESQGFEFQTRARPLDGLLLTGSVGYVDASFVDTPVELGVDGNEQPNTSEWSAAVSSRFEKHLFGQSIGFISADLSYKSSFYWDVGNTLEEPSRTFLNLSTGIEDDHFEIRVFVKNVLDEEFRVSAIPASPGFFSAQGQPGFGRFIGVRGTFRF